MTDAEFTALTGCTFPMKLDDLPAALDRLAKAGYTAKVRGEPGELGLVVGKREEVPCLTLQSTAPSA